MMNNKFKLEEINAVFNVMGRSERLEKIEDSPQNKDILAEIGNQCVGLDNNGDYLIVDIIFEIESLNLDFYENLAVKIRNHFKKPVKSMLIFPIFKEETFGGVVKVLNYKENEEI